MLGSVKTTLHALATILLALAVLVSGILLVHSAIVAMGMAFGTFYLGWWDFNRRLPSWIEKDIKHGREH